MKKFETRKASRFFAVLLSAVMVITTAFTILPQMPSTVYADTVEGTLIDGNAFDKLKVRIRPTGSHKPLSINEDGDGNQNCVHLYYQGKSSQFYLERADEDSYYIYFYKHYKDENPKRSGDCRFDLEDDGGYSKEKQVVHVVSGNATAMNKRWQFIRQAEGSYYVRNKKTGKYWSLDDLGKLKTNNNKLVQRTTPLNWDIEIVSKDNNQFKSKVQYDSRNFTYNGKTVSSNNWMGALSDNLKLSDISIPGTHDSATAYVHKDQKDKSTQRYYIDELLNAGVRHLDIRTGINRDEGSYVRLVHGGSHALNHKGVDLKFEEAMGWIIDFLEANPTETVIIQPKQDHDGDDCDKATYRLLKKYAEGEYGDYIWAGDHVPTLKEVRKKIVIISRLNTEKVGCVVDGKHIYDEHVYDIVKDGKTLQWALDCDHWNDSDGEESDHKAAAHTAKGSNYDVWVQDNYHHGAVAKKEYIQTTLYGKENDKYTNGTQYHYDQSKINGKDAWVFNYTSASNTPMKNAFDLCKEIHQWLYDRSDYNHEDRLVCSDTFTGIMAFDYMDGLMSTKIYKTNFKRNYFKVQGVDVAGNEIGKPLMLQVGENERISKLTNETTKKILEGQFNQNGNDLIAAKDEEGEEIGYIIEEPVTNQADLNSKVKDFNDHVKEGNVPSNLYVLLETPITDVNVTLEMPVCGMHIDAEGKPAPDITVPENASYTVVLKNGEPDTSWVDKNFDIKCGKGYDEEVTLKAKYGYRFAEAGYVHLENSIDYPTITRWIKRNVIPQDNGSPWIKLTFMAPPVPDIQHKDRVEPTCEETGTVEHYRCRGCGRLSLDENLGSYVLPSKLVIPALGHAAGEPVIDTENVTAATCTEVGFHDEVTSCSRCEKELSRTTIVDTALGHEWIVDESTDEEGWSQENNGGTIHEERTCSRCGSTEERNYESGHVHSDSGIRIAPEAASCTKPGIREACLCSCGAFFVIGDGEIDWSKPSTDEELSIPASGHTPKDPVREKQIRYPTCTTGGIYENVVRCEVCNEIISFRYITEGEGYGHRWGEPTYETNWEDGTVTATRVCEIDEDDIETETVHVVTKITKEPTCEEKGSKYYYAEFENEAFETQQSEPVEIEALGHDYDGGETIEPTCSAPGVHTCSRCGETEEIPIDPDAHYTYTTEEDDDTATCTESGEQTQKKICSICGEVIETEKLTTAPLGHAFGEPTYQWADDNSTVTVKHICQRDGCDAEESETVETTSSVMEKSSCDSAGMMKYDAQFENEAFDTLEKAVEIAALKPFKLSAASYTYDGKVKKPKVTVKDTAGKTIDAANYTVTYASGRKNAGTYKVTIKMKGNYTGSKTLNFKINKAANPLKTKAKTAAIKYSKLKKKAQKLAVTKVIKFSKKGKGKMSYKLLSAKKDFKVNAKTGKVTVKKGLKKGTYKVKVKVKAAGNANYKASAWKTVTFKVKVK